jgi:NAD(P)-dependent dehydrogenase (short-subunit alcohol dehydrogenase family)
VTPESSLHPERTALITGGAGDLGKALARAYLDDGGRVVVVDVSETALTRALDELGADDGAVLGVVADISQESAVVDYVEQALGFLGHVDAFFNNAGIEGDCEPVTDYGVERFRRVIDVNLIGAFLGMKYVLPHMVSRKTGAVVNTASVSGLRGAENLSAYVASKHALVGLTRTAALEVAQFGVRVNAICPSGVEGRMISNIEEMGAQRAGETVQRFADRNPSRRLATMTEVADVAVFLASDAARYVNGAAWVIDGGRTAQ